MTEKDELANRFIFSERGRELNSIINDNQGQISANKLLREVFEAGYNAAFESQEPAAKVIYENPNCIGWNPNFEKLPEHGTPLYIKLNGENNESN